MVDINEGIDLLPQNCLQLILNKNSAPNDCFSSSLVCRNWFFLARAACLSLYLVENRGGCTWYDLIKIMKNFSGLEKLKLELRGPCSKLPTEFLEAISEYCTELKSLTITGNGGVEELGLWKLLSKRTNLKHLDIADVFLEKPLVSERTPWPDHSLEELRMGNCLSSLWNGAIRTTPAQKIISSSKNLKLLKLKDWWGCDDDTCRAICSCSTLLEVDLSYTSITSVGLSIIKSSNSSYTYTLS